MTEKCGLKTRYYEQTLKIIRSFNTIEQLDVAFVWALDSVARLETQSPEFDMRIGLIQTTYWRQERKIIKRGTNGSSSSDRFINTHRRVH